MVASVVAVLDVGKTNVKLLAFSEQGDVLAATSTRASSDGLALDVDAVEAWLRGALAAFATTYRVSAFVPTTHGAAMALIGDDERTHAVLDYEASPPADIDAAYDSIRPDFAETLSPRLPAGLNLGRQMYWLQQSRPDVWRRTRAAIAYPQYWAWRLTGVLASEITSLGCHTDLWRPLQSRTSSLVEQQHWGDKLPPMRAAWHRVGTIRREFSPALAGCDVLCGIHDSNAAYLRYLVGVVKPFVLVSTGTWVICFNSAGALTSLDPARDTLANVDVLGNPVACSRFMGGREYAMIIGANAANAATVVPTNADFEAVLNRGVFALPSFASTGGPFPGHIGRVTGTPRSPGEAAALATLYIALMTRVSIRLTGPVERIYIDGPFASNHAYCAILAALMPSIEMFAADDADGAAIGARLLARWPDMGSPPSIPLQTKRVVPMSLSGLEAYASEWEALTNEATT